MFWRRLIISVLIFSVILGTAGYFGYQKLLREQYVVPILMYHSVNVKFTELNNRLVVSPAVFERQMRFLKEHRYVLSLEALADLIREKKPLPPKAVVITFDDGYKDSYTYAFRVLKKYQLPATMFIIIDEVGRPEGDRLSWQEIKEMQSSDLITFGSHALGPEPLVNIKSEEELKRQIFLSKQILEKQLVKEINAFSYAGGMFTPRIRQLVIEAGYKLAVATRPGRDYPSDDVFALKRIRISSSSANWLDFWYRTSGVFTYIKEWHQGR